MALEKNTSKKKKSNKKKHTNKKNIKKTNTKKNTSKKKNIQKKNINKVTNNNIFDRVKNFFKDMLVKYKKLTKPIKLLIIVFGICLVVLILDGLLFLANRNINSGKVFYNSYSSVVSDDSNTVLVGTTDSKETDNESLLKDNSRGKIVKYDYKGNIEFQKIYTKGIASSFKSVISVEDGYIVVGTAIFTEEEKDNQGQEAIIIKYSKDGDIVWEKYYSVLTNTNFSKVIEIEDGYVAVGQSIYANLEVGNHTTGGAIIVKYDKDGNEIWHNNHGGTKSGNFNDVVYTESGIYAVGKDGTDWGNLVKYDLDGKYLWHKNYAYTDSSGFMGIAYLNDNLYVVGSKKILKDENDDDRNTLNTDALFIKYDLDGNIVFEKTFGGSSYEKYNSILVYHNNFYIVGHICSNDAGLKLTNDLTDEMTGLVVRYDINGYILKKEIFGGSNNDNLTGIATDGISFYVSGYSNSKDGNIAVNNNGKDYLGKLIKLNSKFKTIYVR